MNNLQKVAHQILDLPSSHQAIIIKNGMAVVQFAQTHSGCDLLLREAERIAWTIQDSIKNVMERLQWD